ncbi:MAG: hypothetical protein JSV85_03065 [Candidatus Bathyarchaeota archaeon]|nr:MAG: hypothetical protein JSV85_03065 [Candidatus Bathyarchaeota archaeon]
MSTREFLDAWEKMRTRELEDYDGYVEKHGLIDLNVIGWIFKGLGFLLHRKFLNIDTAHELITESTEMTWERVKPMAEDVRNQLGQRKSGEYVPVYKWWEYLYDELQKREQSLQQTQQ